LSDVQISHDKPVATQVTAALRDAIRFGSFTPGLRLSEQEIADMLQLSRQPVREAFIRLSGEGLLEAWPQRGTFVSKISTQEVIASRFVREAVEADIVRLAARNSTTALREQLEDLLRQQEETEGMDASRFMGLDDALHRTLAEAAGRAKIWLYLQKLKSQMDRVRYLVAAELPLQALISQHRTIVEAVVAHDEDRAEAAIRLHLKQILNDLPQIIGAYPDYFNNEPE
jgi:DNA-binding GntR family transcriptional regulator